MAWIELIWRGRWVSDGMLKNTVKKLPSPVHSVAEKICVSAFRRCILICGAI